MNANGRRARQAKNGYNHLCPRQRPGYKKRDVATAAARENRYREKQRTIQANKAKKASKK